MTSIGYLTDAGGLVPLVRTRNKAYRDPIGGAATNLVPRDKPADIYTQVMNVAAARIKKEAEGGNPFAAMWDGRLNRDLVKRPVMTLPYGVTKAGMRNQIVEQMKKQGRDDSWESAQYLADILWDCIGQVVIAAREAMRSVCGLHGIRKITSTTHSMPVGSLRSLRKPSSPARGALGRL